MKKKSHSALTKLRLQQQKLIPLAANCCFLYFFSGVRWQEQISRPIDTAGLCVRMVAPKYSIFECKQGPAQSSEGSSSSSSPLVAACKS